MPVGFTMTIETQKVFRAVIIIVVGLSTEQAADEDDTTTYEMGTFNSSRASAT